MRPQPLTKLRKARQQTLHEIDGLKAKVAERRQRVRRLEAEMRRHFPDFDPKRDPPWPQALMTSSGLSVGFVSREAQRTLQRAAPARLTIREIGTAIMDARGREFAPVDRDRIFEAVRRALTSRRAKFIRGDGGSPERFWIDPDWFKQRPS